MQPLPVHYLYEFMSGKFLLAIKTLFTCKLAPAACAYQSDNREPDDAVWLRSRWYCSGVKEAIGARARSQHSPQREKNGVSTV